MRWSFEDRGDIDVLLLDIAEPEALDTSAKGSVGWFNEPSITFYSTSMYRYVAQIGIKLIKVHSRQTQWQRTERGNPSRIDPTPHPMITDPPPTDSTVVPAPSQKLDSEFNEEENKLEMADTQAEIILSQGRNSSTKEGRSVDEVNDMKITQLNIPTHQMNTKFVNNLPAYWGKYVTNVKQKHGYPTTPLFQNLYTLKPTSLMPKRPQETRSSLQSIVDHWPMFLTPRSATCSFITPQLLFLNLLLSLSKDALMAHYESLANLLKWFPKAVLEARGDMFKLQRKDMLLGQCKETQEKDDPHTSKIKLYMMISKDKVESVDAPGRTFRLPNDAETRDWMTIHPESSYLHDNRSQKCSTEKELSGTGVLVSATKLLVNAITPARLPHLLFIKVDHLQVMEFWPNLQNVVNNNEQQLVPFYDHFKKHIQAANETFFKEVREFEQIFDELEAEYEQCVLANKNLTIEKKNLLIKNDCLIAECLEKDICSIVLTSDIVVPPSSNCLCEDLRSACDREHTKVLELEAEVFKQQKMVIESEKRNSHLQKNHIDLQLKFQNYKQCIDTSSASNAIFEINKLRKQLQGKDDTIRNLDAQINIMKVLNVGTTEGSCDQQALETDRIQLKDTITSLRIQLDGLKVENVSLKRRYDELSKANTHSRTAYTEKLSAFTAENTKLKAQVTGTTSSGPSTSETPKVLAPGMYNLGSKYIPPPKRANWVKPTPVPKKKQVTFSEPPRPSLKPTQKPVVHPNKQTNVCVPMSTGVKPTSGASKTVPKRAPRNHSSLPAKSANARRVEAHHRTLNKKNRVDSNLLVKHSVSVSKMNNVCGACNKSLVFANHTDCLVMCDGSVNVKPHQTKRFKRKPKKEWKPIKRVWKPISKPVANSKPQWKPTGRHFSLFEKYPLTRIMEPTDMPIELPPSASSSPQITMVVQIVLWYLDSGCSRHMTGDRARLINFVEKFIGTVRFGNDEYAAIIGYGQFCVGGLEVAFEAFGVHNPQYDYGRIYYKEWWYFSCKPSGLRSPTSERVVERRDQNSLDAARTMLIFAKAPSVPMGLKL
ncbi:hypothetical protein Tco_0001945 [Tanacetum coccineum]